MYHIILQSVHYEMIENNTNIAIKCVFLSLNTNNVYVLLTINQIWGDYRTCG